MYSCARDVQRPAALTGAICAGLLCDQAVLHLLTCGTLTRHVIGNNALSALLQGHKKDTLTPSF